MAYATASEMIDQIGENQAEDLARAEGGGIDEAALTAALADASGVIDGYLGGRYALAADLARQHCIIIARYALASGAPPEGREGRDYQDTVAFLRAVVAGKTGQQD
ncbi:phage protein Gp36 family protein [Roseospira visakhapatnamensis]|uniref:Phage gp36-like protein n=1 Tax=Roseospira visakhapatnamensis TaxID=390880 RepID=A0A7W6RGS5_9PROT|nr:phage protein Gp36 family protein [Roseospira visakhapatnamensis]MBB4268284.1 phage gp36-like protein [Roseospira visakhapatnamensis]